MKTNIYVSKLVLSEIKQCTIPTILRHQEVNAMSNTQNTNKSDSMKEKQIVFRVTEAQHREIRIKAAYEGDLTPNQYAKKFLLEKLGIETDSTDSDLNKS